MFNFKKLLVPKSLDTTTVETIQTWRVTWTSRYGPWHDSTQEEVEIFTNEQQAKNFSIALENAFSLIRHTCGTTVTIKKEK